MTEPNKEPVRTPLPMRQDEVAPSGIAAKHDTVRIVLPSRTPVAPVRRLPPKITPAPAADSAPHPSPISHRCAPVRPPERTTVSALLRPLPKPPGAQLNETNTSIAAALETQPASSIPPGPKNETARITVLPRPAPASKPLDPFEALPRSFCWGLFGIAVLIFLIQIWNYVVS